MITATANRISWPALYKRFYDKAHGRISDHFAKTALNLLGDAESVMADCPCGRCGPIDVSVTDSGSVAALFRLADKSVCTLVIHRDETIDVLGGNGADVVGFKLGAADLVRD